MILIKLNLPFNLSRRLDLRNKSLTSPFELNLIKNSYLNTEQSHFRQASSINNISKAQYISGLTQSDGSFFCSIEKVIKKDKSKGLTFTPIFDLTADLDSKHALDLIQNYFCCGSVSINYKDSTARYRVINRADLINIIIPHFKAYPVFFNKLHAFNLFIQILEHLSLKPKDRDLKEILKLSVSMNTSSRRTDDEIKKLCDILDISPVTKIPDKTLKLTSELTAGFLSGMIDGDGSFNISFPQNLETGKIKPVLSICIGPTSLPFIEEFKKYLGPSGTLEKSKNILVLKITNLNHLIDYVIPFVESNLMITEKKEHYNIWKKVCFILKRDKLLSKEALLEIVELAYNMNKGGKRRKINKRQYIEIVNKYSSND